MTRIRLHERPACPRFSGFFARVYTARRASSSSGFLSLAWPDPRRERPRLRPRRFVGACAKFETQPLSPILFIYLSFFFSGYLFASLLLLRLPIYFHYFCLFYSVYFSLFHFLLFYLFLCFYDTSFFSWCVFDVPVITQHNGMALHFRCLPGTT